MALSLALLRAAAVGSRRGAGVAAGAGTGVAAGSGLGVAAATVGRGWLAAAGRPGGRSGRISLTDTTGR
jgi:hypothetical protein